MKNRLFPHINKTLPLFSAKSRPLTIKTPSSSELGDDLDTNQGSCNT